MRRIAFVVLALVFSTDLHAAQRTFVSALGVDTNLCSRTQPCRNFTAAMALTDVDGEVIVLDSAGYGAFTPTKALMIVAPPGVYAGVTAFTGNAILVNAGATEKIVLRGLTLNGLGADNGVEYDSVGSLYIENVVANGFVHAAIYDFSSGANQLYLSDTLLRNNARGLAVYGIGGEGLRSILIDHCRSENNVTEGFDIEAYARAVIRDSIAVGGASGFRLGPNGSAAIPDGVIENCVASFNGTGYIIGKNGHDTYAVINNSIASNNTIGLDTSSFGHALISNCTITRNTSGLVGTGTHQILSRGNNTIAWNGTDGAPTGTVAAQ
jgi:hypothetical protein